MDDDPGKRLFTFAVITDTHLNQGEAECNSPFEVNRLANGRMRHVVRELNAREELAFVIHLGDLLHPVPAIAHLYERAAAEFKAQVADLRHPLHLIPGNHDVGDKPIDWGPAGVVRDEFLALWRTHFGANYRAFDHGGCRFVLMDAQIVNSGLSAEAEQRAWLEAELAGNDGRRIFLGSHYPPYLTDPGEDEHYDNLGEPGRTWLLDLMTRCRVEALFAGHVHNFWYHRHGPTDCYLLPSTAFVRQDYAEMARVAPAPESEGGRNDAAKLGYFLVHVHERGHLCEVVRTFGRVAAPDSPSPQPVARIAPVHPRENPASRFGFDMRQNWLEVVEIPPSGGLDEFDRKRARNDYALMALLEMGVSRVRIPARDLLDPEHRSRLVACAALGLRFTLFSFGVPGRGLGEAVENAGGLIDTWEIAHARDRLPEAVAAAAGPAAKAGAALHVSKLRSKDEMERGEKYYHMINHGFTADEAEQIADAAGVEGVAGVVFRIPGETSPWTAAQEASALCARTGLCASLHVRMSRGHPGSDQADQDWVTRRALEALAGASAHQRVHVWVDAFADIDRGYFPRQGVVNRLYNPRPAFHALRHATAVLARAPAPLHPSGHGATPVLTDASGRRYVILGGDYHVPALAPANGQLIDLLTGESRPAPWTGRNLDSHHAHGPCLWVSEAVPG